MVITLYTWGGGGSRVRELIEKQTKITTYTETYFQNEGNKGKGARSRTNKSWNKNKRHWFLKPN